MLLHLLRYFVVSNSFSGVTVLGIRLQMLLSLLRLRYFFRWRPLTRIPFIFSRSDTFLNPSLSYVQKPTNVSLMSHSSLVALSPLSQRLPDHAKSI